MTTLSKLSTPVIRFLAASAIAFGLLPSMAHAQGFMGNGPQHLRYAADGIPPHFQSLDLSQEQQEKLQAIQASHREVMRKNMAQLSTNKAAERQLVEASTFDEQQARKLAAQDAKIMEDSNLATLRFRHEVYQTLTPEQRVKFDALRQQRPLNRPR